ncbi:MAG: ABC transporter substrate-binding protein [Ilumatobacteraceae bacterium]|nr:ABC transporter substrate-binding protein [Ilumatobacteraceae bacterium]
MKANLFSAKKLTRRVLIGTLLAFSSIAAACGSDSSTSPDSVAVDSTQVVSEAPQKIISLSATHTEILFAVGAGDQVIAIDSMSNYPAESAGVLTDLSAYEPSVEAITAYEPDLVVIGDDFVGLAEQLTAVGIESWVSSAPTTLDEAYAQIEDLGTVVGHGDEAIALATSMKSDIDAIIAQAPALDQPISFYHELDDMNYSVTSNTFIGSIYAALGLQNIADATQGDTDYPQLSAEFIVSQNPDMIFLSDTKCCGVTAASVAARPGWEVLSAVQGGGIVELDDDVASRWGPRLVEFVQVLSDGVNAYLKTLS